MRLLIIVEEAAWGQLTSLYARHQRAEELLRYFGAPGRSSRASYVIFLSYMHLLTLYLYRPCASRAPRCHGPGFSDDAQEARVDVYFEAMGDLFDYGDEVGMRRLAFGTVCVPRFSISRAMDARAMVSLDYLLMDKVAMLDDKSRALGVCRAMMALRLITRCPGGGVFLAIVWRCQRC